MIRPLRTAHNHLLTRPWSPCIRRKTLKPPGAAAVKRPQPAPKKDAHEAAGPSSPTSPGTRAAIKVAQLADAAEQVQAPQLRKSTRQRVEDAEKERVRIEQVGNNKRMSKTYVVQGKGAVHLFV